MVLIFVVFYFLLIRPQEKKRRNQETLVSGVKKGEEVMTNSGLFGVVTKINDSDNTVMVQIAKDVEVKVLKNSIADIISRSKKVEDNKNKKQIDDKDASSTKQKKK
jgi:preprotein translocase subunit YajC